MWLYQNKVIEKLEDLPNKCFGFIYQITNLINNRSYFGKKQILSKVNKKLGKKEIAALPTKRGRIPSKKLVTSESNWLTYWGSCKPLLEDVKQLGEENFKREILMFCNTKKQLTFYEMMYQIKNDVLFNDSYNDNILAKFHRRDFI